MSLSLYSYKGVGTVKLKIFVYLCIGFATAIFTSRAMDSTQTLIAMISLPFMGLLHELTHLMAINIIGAQHKFMFRGLYIGFNVVVEKVEDFIAIALAPQLLTIALAMLYLLLRSGIALALAIVHISVSIEDLQKVIKYSKPFIYNNIKACIRILQNDFR